MSVGHVHGAHAEHTRGQQTRRGSQEIDLRVTRPDGQKAMTARPRLNFGRSTAYEVLERAQRPESQQSASLALPVESAVAVGDHLELVSSAGPQQALLDATAQVAVPGEVTPPADKPAPVTEATPATEEASATGKSLAVATPETDPAPLPEGGSALHYGSVPVLIAGQLTELDLYALGQRPDAGARPSRRLVLSLNGTGGGRMDLFASVSGGRLRVSSADVEHVLAMRELATRLGWKFDSVEEIPASDTSMTPTSELDRLL